MEKKNILYQEKGDLITNIEILQSRLKQVNTEIFEILQNERKQPGSIVEEV